MTAPLLSTKLNVPRPRHDLVPRPRLVQRLNDGLHRKLTLISAPAGVYVWDLVAAANAADPTLCPLVPLSVEVVTAAGPEQGRTAVREGPPNTAVCLGPDGEGVKAAAAGVLGR
jgi:inosine-uridine nucleoside N-ribohydrolase